jgi:hypothetical protein
LPAFYRKLASEVIRVQQSVGRRTRFVAGLGLFAVLIAALSVLAREYLRARDQSHVVEMLKKRGFGVIYGWQWNFEDQCSRDATVMRRILGNELFANVVIVSGADVSDDDLELIARLAGLVEIEATVTRAVTDRGLENIDKMTRLQRIPRLRSPLITDLGVEHLAALPMLETLSIAGNISDAGVAKLSRMKSLRILELHSPQLTDKGVLEFTHAASLMRLSLYAPKITDQAIQKVRDANDGMIVDYQNERF